MTDPFAHFDGAYVLGALEPADRVAFEAHLASCPDCARRVDELAGLPAALAGVSPADLVDDGADGADDSHGSVETVPDTLLPGLLRRVRHTRRRRTIVTGAVAGLAACIAALITALAVSSPGTHPPAGRAMHAVIATPVHATVALAGRSWGTEITLRCSYDAVAGGSGPLAYAMTAVGRDGRHYSLGTWNIGPGQDLTFVGGTALQPSQIARVEVTVPGGPPILRLTT